MGSDPLHGVTLKDILEKLVAAYGWDGLAHAIRINCFANNPSVTSSLKFLRRTPWARERVEMMYLRHVGSPAPTLRRSQPLRMPEEEAGTSPTS